MVGRLYTAEDEIDVIHEDLGRARRRLYQLERAEVEGRVASKWHHRWTLRKARERVTELERDLTQAHEAFADGLTTGLDEWLGGRP